MKYFNALYAGLMSFLTIFSAYGMDAPQDDQFLGLFNDASKAIGLCIMNKHKAVTDKVLEMSLAQDISQKILKTHPILHNYGFAPESLNQIANLRYTSSEIPLLEKLKEVSIKACIATQPQQLCPLLENAFAGLNCKNEIYQTIEKSPQIINEIAQKSKQDTLSLIEELTKRAPKKSVYLKKHSENLKSITSVCNEAYQNLLKETKKKVLAICNKIMNSTLPKNPIMRLPLDRSLFGQLELDTSELEQSMVYKPSKDELLKQLKKQLREFRKTKQKTTLEWLTTRKKLLEEYLTAFPDDEVYKKDLVRVENAIKKHALKPSIKQKTEELKEKGSPELLEAYLKELEEAEEISPNNKIKEAIVTIKHTINILRPLKIISEHNKGPLFIDGNISTDAQVIIDNIITLANNIELADEEDKIKINELIEHPLLQQKNKSISSLTLYSIDLAPILAKNIIGGLEALIKFQNACKKIKEIVPQFPVPYRMNLDEMEKAEQRIKSGLLLPGIAEKTINTFFPENIPAFKDDRKKLLDLAQGEITSTLHQIEENINTSNFLSVTTKDRLPARHERMAKELEQDRQLIATLEFGDAQELKNRAKKLAEDIAIALNNYYAIMNIPSITLTTPTPEKEIPQIPVEPEITPTTISGQKPVEQEIPATSTAQKAEYDSEQYLKNLSNQELVSKIDALASYILEPKASHILESSVDENALTTLLEDVDQLIKNESDTATDGTIKSEAFIYLAKAIDQLTNIAKKIKGDDLKKKISTQISLLTNKITANKIILINQIKERKGKFNLPEMNSIKDLINHYYFKLYANQPNEVLFYTKKEVIDAVREIARNEAIQAIEGCNTPGLFKEDKSDISPCAVTVMKEMINLANNIILGDTLKKEDINKIARLSENSLLQQKEGQQSLTFRKESDTKIKNTPTGSTLWKEFSRACKKIGQYTYLKDFPVPKISIEAASPIVPIQTAEQPVISPLKITPPTVSATPSLMSEQSYTSTQPKPVVAPQPSPQPPTALPAPASELPQGQPTAPTTPQKELPALSFGERIWNAISAPFRYISDWLWKVYG